MPRALLIVFLMRRHLDEGAQQAKRGEFVNQSLDDILDEFKAGRDER